MTDALMSSLLAALNEAAGVPDGKMIEAARAIPAEKRISAPLTAQASGSLAENRFAATISTGMAKVRAGNDGARF